MLSTCVYKILNVDFWVCKDGEVVMWTTKQNHKQIHTERQKDRETKRQIQWSGLSGLAIIVLMAPHLFQSRPAPPAVSPLNLSPKCYNYKYNHKYKYIYKYLHNYKFAHKHTHTHKCYIENSIAKINTNIASPTRMLIFSTWKFFFHKFNKTNNIMISWYWRNIF